MRLIDKINVRDIIVDHYKTLVSYETNKQHLSDYLLFLGFPLVAALSSVYLSFQMNQNAVSVVITAVSILAGLLFNLLVLIHAIKNKDRVYVGKGDSKRFFGEIYANVSYAICISLASLVPLTILAVAQNQTVLTCANAISIFLTSHLFLVLFMILKRIHSLLRLEF